MKIQHNLRAYSLGILLSLSAQTWADDNSHQQAANALLDVMNINTLLSESVEAMLQLEIQNNPSLKPFEQTMRDFFEIYMGAESLRPNFIQLYTDTFTESELNEIIDFYKTPTGQKTLATAPDLMAKGAAIGQQRVMENITELQYMIEQESARIAELQKQNP